MISPSHGDSSHPLPQAGEGPRGRRPDEGKLFHTRRKHFFHERDVAAVDGHLVTSAVGPDWMGYTAVRHQPFVVALLIAIVDCRAGEHAVAVMLVGTDGGNADVRAE